MYETGLIKSEVEKHINPSMKGVDIGSGGYPIFSNSISIDLRNQGTVHFQGNAISLPWFADNSLDYAFSSHCLEDFDTPEKLIAIREWTRVIRPGGFLALYLPDQVKYVDYCTRRNEYCNADHKDPTFNIETLRQLVKEAVGSQLEEIYSIEQHADYSFYVIFKKKTTVNLLRPGSIGDVLISSVIIPGLRKKHGDCQIHYYTHMTEAVSMIDGIDGILHSSEWEKRLPGPSYCLNAYPNERGDMSPLKKHLVEYYAELCDIPVNWNYSLKPLNGYSIPGVDGDYISLHIKTGWSVYKEWDTAKWAFVVKELNLPVVQIGGADEPYVAGAIDMRGKTTLSESSAIIKGAKLHLGVDSFTNHIAGAFKKPAVILFGSTSPIGSGYRTATNIYKSLDCQPCYKENPEISANPRGTCDHKSCMNTITVDDVTDAIQSILTKLDTPQVYEVDPNKVNKICLNMIVKNEAHVINRCLDSIMPLITSWCILDTGSTDGTQDIIRDRLKHLPGELHESTWKGFDVSRSEAIQLARAAKEPADYLLFIDADDCMVIQEKGDLLPKLTSDSYHLQHRHGDTVFLRRDIVSTKYNWKYVGVLHEYVECPEPVSNMELQGMYIYERREGSRSNDPQKYQKDAQILEQGLINEPNNSRYMFYLGQSYRDCGQYEKAIDAYKRRVAAGGWEEEVYYSLLQIAQMREAMGSDDSEIVLAYLQAYQFRPSRAEAIGLLARFMRCKGQNYLAVMFAETGIRIPKTTDLLFVDESFQKWRCLDEFAVAAYWTGRYQDCLDACNRLLTEGHLPEDQRDRIIKNSEFATIRLQ